MSCSPASTEKSDREIVADAVNHLVSGKRHLLVNDYVAAVASLQEACQIFSKTYGETANECAEPYLFYGKALLEFSRMETGVLGNALQGVTPEEEDDSEDEDEEEDEQVENPEKVTGEEREQIIRQVEAAIDENSRELDEKMAEMQKADSNLKSQLSPKLSEECTKDTDNSGSSSTEAPVVQEKKLDSEESKKCDGLEKNDSEEQMEVSAAEEAKVEVPTLEEKSLEDGTEDSKKAAESEMTTELEESKKSAEAEEPKSDQQTKEDEKNKGNVEKSPSGEPSKASDTGSDNIVKDESSVVTNEEVQDKTVAEEESEAMEIDLKSEDQNVPEGAKVSEPSSPGPEKCKEEPAVTENEKTDEPQVKESQPEEKKLEETGGSRENESEMSTEGTDGNKEDQSLEPKLDNVTEDACQSDKSETIAKAEVSEVSSKSTTENDAVESKDDTETKVGETKTVEGTDNDKKELHKELEVVKDDADANKKQNDSAVDEEMDGETEDMNENTTGEESESTGEKSQDESATHGDEAGPSTSTGVCKEESEEDVTNLQLAWEMLELSKVIFKRQAETDKTKELKVAEVLLKLGEVSIESENYGQAVEDLTECLSIQKRNLEPHDRALAETLYQLGLATSFNNQYEVAIENFTNSMKVIEDRINFLKKCEEDRENSKPSVPNAASSTDKDAKENAVTDATNELNKENNLESTKENNTSSETSATGASESTSKSNEDNETKTAEDRVKPAEDSSAEGGEVEEKAKDGKSVEEKKTEESEENMDTSTGDNKTGENASTDASNENIGDSKTVISTKDENISSENKCTDGSKEQTANDVPDDPWQDTKREIEELEGLIPDIKAKIDDTEDLMKNAMQSIKEAALQRLSENTEQPSAKSEEKKKPVSNISHLVKRKRKPEDDSSGSGDLKKPRPSEEVEENHVNGDSVLNGDAKPMETEESKVKVAPMDTQPEAEPSVA